MTDTQTPKLVPQTKAVVCPNCGAPVTIRAAGQATNVICDHCHTILDARTETLRIIQTFAARERFQPLIPLGSRGQLEGIPWECIGFQVREIEVEGVAYRWAEYLLYNPYAGYRYVTEYQGHWNIGKAWPALPTLTHKGRKEAAWLGSKLYTHFQTSQARTIHVMGEFPWQVRFGETVTVKDYIAPPSLLSAEITSNEITWTLSQYIPGRDIWKAFQLEGLPPATIGVYENQPSPYQGGVGSAWKTFFALLILMVAVSIGMHAVMRDETVFSQSYSFVQQPTKSDTAFVTSDFELKGRPSTVQIDISTDLDQDWAFFGLSLIDEQNGTAYNVGKEISYYHDSDGSEGSKNGSARISNVPFGHYYLRVEPEMDTSPSGKSVRYSLTVRRDVPGMVPFVFAFFLLLIPPIFMTIRSVKFENSRWAESDYGPIFKSGGDD